MAADVVLCLNGGSSSLKLALYALDGGRETAHARGLIERIGLAGGHLRVTGADGAALIDADGAFPDHRAAVTAALDAIARLALPPPAAAGHRLVHGGTDHVGPERVTPALLTALRALVPFAPLHLPSEIVAIEAVAARFPDLPQVACFDTAFHRRMPARAQRLPLPRALWGEGVCRYGFHGLSYEYVVHALGDAGRGRVVIAHLGNGASMAAVRGGAPMDTTMGFTPTGGVMMGTRSGDLDPGVLLYLLRTKGWDAERIDRLVNHESGLLGVSGTTPDMRSLLERRTTDPEAALAVDLFCYQLRKQVGAFAAALGGLDALVFTGGIGEHAAPVREEVCAGLAHLGVVLDPARNAAHADPIHAPASRCAVRVIATNEDLMIARHVRRVVFGRET